MRDLAFKVSEPPAQNRYMSSREFAELRGVNGICVKDKAAITPHAGKRKLLWWLQAKSLAEGGLKKVGLDLLAMFPERIGTPTMHKLGLDPAKMVPWDTARDVYWELGVLDASDLMAGERSDQQRRPVPMKNLQGLCLQAAKTSGHNSESHYNGDRRAPSIEAFLVDLCINPRLHIELAGEGSETLRDLEREGAKERYTDLEDVDFETADLPYFRDIVGALIEYLKRHEAMVKDGFQLTEIGRQIWKTLDFALKSKGMVLIDGLEGRGKTEAAKAWCQLHLGEARFVSLKGINSRTAAFREIAKALGVASTYTRNAFEMQARVEDLLERSKLMLVVDEAHWLFNQSARVYTRPELVDWIVTGVCNRHVPIALVTTPQFLQCMARVIEQVGWNHKQFQRRVSRRKVLPTKNTLPDIEAVARSIFPKASNSTIQRVMGYVLMSKRDLSALGDIARELRFLLNPEDPDKVDLAKSPVTFDQVEEVIEANLIPSDTAFARDLGAVLQNQPGRKPRRVRGAPRSLPDLDPEDPEVPSQAAPVRGITPVSEGRPRCAQQVESAA